MPVASIKKFKVGDAVCRLYFPSEGVGIIVSLGIDSVTIYLGKNEWITEYLAFANVLFNSETKNILLKDLIKESNVIIFESLRPGDLITVGRIKKANAFVLKTYEVPARTRQFVTNIRVEILEDSRKKLLSVKQDVIIVRRVE